MKIELDDLIRNGLIDATHTGTHTIMKNNITPEQRQQILEEVKTNYPLLKDKINSLVALIRNKIVRCDPIRILMSASDLFLASNIGIVSEYQLDKEAIFASRMTEYIQSVIVSSPSEYVPNQLTSEEENKLITEIQNDIDNLFELVDEFLLSWSISVKDLYPNCDENIRKTMIELQRLYTVRGKCYQILEKEYLEKLLTSHNQTFLNLFNISTEQIICGFDKLQFALSQGKLAALNEFMGIVDEYIDSGKRDIKDFFDSNPNQSSAFFDRFLGTSLRDVFEITGWPEAFMRALSYEINEDSKFFSHDDFSGWPIIDLPIQKKPFIKIGPHYYCFDYYSFVDNFYRVIQKAVTKLVPAHVWSDAQKEASEDMVASVFSELLPGSTINKDNHYPKNTSLKKMRENDLIIEYKNVLLIVEVKASSFIYTSPMTDFEGYISSYKKLIEEPTSQCKYTYDYLCSRSTAALYYKNGETKSQIDMTEIKDIYTFSVTIDNINDFAARAEKLSFLELSGNTICLSIDDLMVYREYFDSPLIFLHFLEQRRQATREPLLNLSDELDHLGMYIEHNMYCLQLKDYPDNAQLRFHGYRKALDNYFCQLYHPELCPHKPSLKLPGLFLSIISYLEKSDVEDAIQISKYLLNFSTDAKEQLCKSVEYALFRQPQIRHMLAFGTAGDGEFTLRYTGFVEQPGIQVFTEEYKRQYTLSTLLWNDDPDRVMLDFRYDNNGKFIGFAYKQYSISDIHQTERKKLWDMGKERASIRLQAYLKQHKIIDDSDICPCESGKTYEKCCKMHL